MVMEYWPKREQRKRGSIFLLKIIQLSKSPPRSTVFTSSATPVFIGKCELMRASSLPPPITGFAEGEAITCRSSCQKLVWSNPYLAADMVYEHRTCIWNPKIPESGGHRTGWVGQTWKSWNSSWTIYASKTTKLHNLINDINQYNSE